jgi:hypothetical protein
VIVYRPCGTVMLNAPLPSVDVVVVDGPDTTTFAPATAPPVPLRTVPCRTVVVADGAVDAAGVDCADAPAVLIAVATAITAIVRQQ